jgi:hypothetical protein
MEIANATEPAQDGRIYIEQVIFSMAIFASLRASYVRPRAW